MGFEYWFMFWFTSLGMPAIIAIAAYIAVRLHERSMRD